MIKECEICFKSYWEKDKFNDNWLCSKRCLNKSLKLWLWN